MLQGGFFYRVLARGRDTNGHGRDQMMMSTESKEEGSWNMSKGHMPDGHKSKASCLFLIRVGLALRKEQEPHASLCLLTGARGASEIGDRREAIAAAIGEAGPEDIVLIAGKGHEQGQIVGDMVLPFDDVAVARECAG